MGHYSSSGNNLFMVIGNFLEVTGLLIRIFLLEAIQNISVLIHFGKRLEAWISKLRIIYYASLLLPVGRMLSSYDD